MSAFDPQLLQALGAADAQAPPPAGTAITPASLRAAASRRRRRRLAAGSVLTAIVCAVAMPLPRRAAGVGGDGDGGDVRVQLRSLRANLEGLQAQLHRLVPAAAGVDDADHRAAAELRYQLADARAGAVTAPAPRTGK